jgi:hypothetical protein
MSIKLMGQVWECQFTKAEQSVMLAMADHAQDDGSKCFPSVDRIAWKTDYSARQVQRTIKELCGRGILVAVHKAGRARAVEYRIDLKQAEPKPEFQSRKGDMVSPYQPKGDMVSPHKTKYDTMSPIDERERVTFDGLKGDIAMSPESLTNKGINGNGIDSLVLESDIWEKCKNELLPSLPGVAKTFLDGSVLVADSDLEYRVVITEHNARGLGWLQVQAGPAIKRKLTSLLKKPVSVEIVCLEKELA